jgi:hypothetical protein
MQKYLLLNVKRKMYVLSVCGIIEHFLNHIYLQVHMKQCTLVLEGCPNKCGSTVERREMQNHLDNECMNKRKPTNNLQLTDHSQHTTNPQATTDVGHHETRQVTMYFIEAIMFKSEYNKNTRGLNICGNVTSADTNCPTSEYAALQHD